MSDVFVTGGSGFVGGALIRRLVADHRYVRALARSEAAAAAIRGLGADPVAGDLDDPGSLLDAIRGADTVFNVAGVNVMCLVDPAPMQRTNVEGAAAVVRAAAAAKVSRLVHTSSAATIGEPAGQVGREPTKHRGTFLSRYERSKLMGERRVLALGEELGVHVVCVNPSSVQGPGRLEGSSQLLLDIVNERLRILVDTFVSVVDIDDCVDAHVRAESRGVPGERYLINGASLSIEDAVALLLRVCGHPRAVRYAPRSLVRAGGPVVGVLARLVGKEGAPCPEMVRTLLHGHRYDGSLAVRALGLRYTPLELTVRRTLAWYAERGMAPPPLPPRQA